jgi:hypothetical protein
VTYGLYIYINFTKEANMSESEKKSRVRSPNYPLISIEKAIGYVQILYDKHSRYSVALPVIGDDWGLKGSYLAQHIAAISSYGLIEVGGGSGDSREIKISDLAYKIMLDKRPNSKEREDLIREAALNPPIFNKIYSTYQPKLPDGHLLEYELVNKYSFNAIAVKSFIAVFKETMDFTNLYKKDIIDGKNATTEEPNMIIIDKPEIKGGQPGKTHPTILTDANEREIATYTIGRGLKARILISGDQLTTIKSIEKLLNRMQEDKDDMIESIADEKDEPTQQ